MESTNTNIQTLREALETPAKKLKQTAGRDVGVHRHVNSTIVIPNDLAYMGAAKALLARAEEDDKPISRQEHFRCHPNDGLVALTRVLKETFGWLSAEPVKTMFGPQPPTIVRLATSLTTHEEVVGGGGISHPQLPGLEIHVGGNVSTMQFTMVVSGKQRHGPLVNALFAEVQQRLDTQSIYKGKAINSQFEFINTGSVSPADIIYTKEAEEQVWANIFVPLMHRDKLAAAGIPFKRGVLLEGPYGGGKSMTANAAAGIAQEYGITYIYVRPDDFPDLESHLRYAQQYAPSIVFFEDIDQVLSGTDRDAAVNKILDQLDGLESKAGKAQDIMVILTTNHVEKINPALLRPGRIDGVIHLGPPDAYAASKLVQHYGADMLAPNVDLDEIGRACDGMSPAFIREIVERAKLHSIRRDPSQRPRLTTADLLASSHGIQTQLALAVPPEDNPTVEERLGGALAEIIETATDEVMHERLGGFFSEATRDSLDMYYGKGAEERAAQMAPSR